MIPTLYEPFRHWSDGGSVFLLSDLHFDDPDCRLMDPGWVTPEKQLAVWKTTKWWRRFGPLGVHRRSEPPAPLQKQFKYRHTVYRVGTAVRHAHPLGMPLDRSDRQTFVSDGFRYVIGGFLHDMQPPAQPSDGLMVGAVGGEMGTI